MVQCLLDLTISTCGPHGKHCCRERYFFQSRFRLTWILSTDELSFMIFFNSYSLIVLITEFSLCAVTKSDPTLPWRLRRRSSEFEEIHVRDPGCWLTISFIWSLFSVFDFKRNPYLLNTKHWTDIISPDRFCLVIWRLSTIRFILPRYVSESIHTCPLATTSLLRACPWLLVSIISISCDNFKAFFCKHWRILSFILGILLGFRWAPCWGKTIFFCVVLPFCTDGSLRILFFDYLLSFSDSLQKISKSLNNSVP